MNSNQPSMETSAAARATESTAPSAAAGTAASYSGGPDATRDPLSAIASEVAGLARSLQFSAQTTLDSARVAVRNVALKVAVGLASVFCVMLLICVGWVLALVGAAGMLSAVFDLPPWFGNTVVGVLGVVGPVLVVRHRIAAMRASALNALRARYSSERPRENAA